MDRQIDTIKNAIHDLRESFAKLSSVFDRALKDLDQAIDHIEHEYRSAEDADDADE